MTMTGAELFVIFGVGCWAAWLLARRGFLISQIDAELAQAAVLRADLERLVDLGLVEESHPWYVDRRAALEDLAKVPAVLFPGLVSIVVLMASAPPSAAGAWTRTPNVPEARAFDARMNGMFLRCFKYRSVLVWAVLKAYDHSPPLAQLRLALHRIAAGVDAARTHRLRPA